MGLNEGVISAARNCANAANVSYEPNLTDAAKCTKVRFGGSVASRRAHEDGAFKKDQSILTPTYDFSEAEPVSGPRALRDGGSIVLVLRMRDAKLQLRYTVGPRDESLQPAGVAARLHRASTNFSETFTIFAVCVLLCHIVEASGQLSRFGAALYLSGRMAFLPLYAAGVPWLRTFAWNAATLGIVLVGAQCVV